MQEKAPLQYEGDDDMVEIELPESMNLEHLKNYPKNPRLFEDIAVTVSNPSVVSKGIRKHVEYLITGTDNSGPFRATRRFKDFLKLRGILSKEWPGCYIPDIPPKKTFGNLNPFFIEKRRKLLEIFLQNMSSLVFIYSSDVFQSFIRWKEDEFSQNTMESKSFHIEQIYDKYQNHFSEYSLYESPEEFTRIVESSQTIFELAEKMLRLFEKQCIAIVETYSNYGKWSQKLIKKLETVSKLIRETDNVIMVEKRSSFYNAGFVLLDWVRAEIIDLGAILSAIKQKHELDKMTIKAKESLDQITIKIESLKTGKRTFSQKITGKNIEELIEESNRKLAVESREYEHLRVITEIIVCRLATKDIKIFMEGSSTKCERVLKAFSDLNMQEYSFYRGQFKGIFSSIDSN